MEKFTKLTGDAVPLIRDNIDTDVIIPVPWCKAFSADLGDGLFARWRYTTDAIVDPVENPDFLLNKAQYKDSRILIAGDNFGCGSSREHAVWALMKFGICCVIARSFGEIFYNNCFKNGLLPVTLPEAEWQRVVDAVKLVDGEAPMTIDLEKCEIVTPAGDIVPFDIDPARRKDLLQGLDFIAITLKYEEEIAAFQKLDRVRQPWIYQYAPMVTDS